MKKHFLILPLTASILAACSANSPAPVVNASGSSELSPGIMQPVEGTGASNNMGWQTADIQPVSMPNTMNTPAVSAPSYQPTTAQPPVIQQPVQPQTITKVVKKTKTVEKKVDQNFEIPRDANNVPIYSQIQKGFYDGSTYTVRKGDTMFLIAYVIGKDVKEIATLNNMSEPYQLTVGQKLKTGKSGTETITVEETVTVPAQPKVTYQQGANGTVYSSEGEITGPVKAGTVAVNTASRPAVQASVGRVAPAVVASTATTPQVTATTVTAQNQAAASSIKWVSPTAGRIVQGFSNSDGGNKGIDIAGQKGQDVKAAATGKVVYAGNALEGYGNLIIIKHNDDFLSAYAHNDRILVDEQDNVKAGQKIATMGSTGTSSNKLHFEIRYKGKSIDPMRYLPKQ
ncbi:outer membrane antigenic lipoprotein B [Haemophilus parahaemolyticus]|uniref:Outer membrane antigenic lipoprotein B n=1 Tax=Haemophilus parahaemolyticus TaxID=735 RepID=A0A377HZK1_HAEPH|nr:murein hydrolase activator NlpD [Haemophilus parahaemolyticus]STO63716.1 outer membrane antigenic lipoprotein B [Haemophilus parahaemolyticus]